MVAVLGPHAAILATEALRWRDVSVVSLVPLNLPPVLGGRVSVVDKLEPASVDVLLTSPEQNPNVWLRAVRPGGVVQATTLDPSKANRVLAAMRASVGGAKPWREYLPQPIYGAIACLGGTCKRLREPPSGTKRLTTQYLPCLFTFGKDELPLVFSSNPDKLVASQH